jgi:uncharacterized membrane protein YkvA (DUF1232 family)
MSWREWLRSKAARFEREVSALALACRDPRVGWPSRLVVLLTLLYIISPIDLIPESAHILGVVDDLILLPLTIFIAVRLVPADVMADCRTRAAMRPFRDLRWWVVVLIVVAWQIVTVLLASWWTG